MILRDRHYIVRGGPLRYRDAGLLLRNIIIRGKVFKPSQRPDLHTEDPAIREEAGQPLEPLFNGLHVCQRIAKGATTGAIKDDPVDEGYRCV